MESISIRVSGSFQSEQDIANINFSAGGRMLRLSDIAQVRRGYTDPPQPMFRINGKPAIGLAIAIRDGGDILALGANIRKAMAQITADLPIGIEPSLVADQPVVVDQAIREFTVSLMQAIGIIMVVSFISLGVRPGLIIALAYRSRWRSCFRSWDFSASICSEYRLARSSLRSHCWSTMR